MVCLAISPEGCSFGRVVCFAAIWEPHSGLFP
jgi:hypothetical protein